jgi:transcription antitermination factor NusG
MATRGSGSNLAFKRYVQVGRVVLINKGEFSGKLAVIVEIIDHNKVSLQLSVEKVMVFLMFASSGHH